MAASLPAALGKILIFSCDTELLRRLDSKLGTERYAVETFDSAQDALLFLARSCPDLLIIDLDTGDGADLLSRVRAQWPALRVVVFATRELRQDTTVGVHPCVVGGLSRPLDDAELRVVVDRAFKFFHTANADDIWDAELMTRHPPLFEALRHARLVAPTDASVLIIGDVGTGKELLAQAIHRASGRRHKPFSVVNCGGIGETFVEYEVLGAEHGVFTSTARSLDSLFAMAAGSTLLLDNVDAMPAHLHPELLRLLKKNRRHAGTEDPAEQSDVRIIASTSRDLRALAVDGRFPADLAYRLGIVSIRLPTLSDRREHIPLLANHFLERIAAETGQQKKLYTPEGLQLLASAEWPGNLRQLSRIVRRNVAMSHSPVIDARLVAGSLGDRADQSTPCAGDHDELMRDYLAQILELSGGRVSRAARLAKRNRTDFFELLAHHGLDPESFRRP